MGRQRGCRRLGCELSEGVISRRFTRRFPHGHYRAGTAPFFLRQPDPRLHALRRWVRPFMSSSSPATAWFPGILTALPPGDERA
jgi:hypothetical protein